MDLMEQLQKTANEAYPEEGRINRGLAAETFLGTGPVGHLAKKHNALGVNEDDSHTVANAKLGGLGSAVPGAAYGGVLGGALTHAKGGGKGAVAGGAALGAGALGALYGGVGAGAGAINGMLHDKYDDHLRSKQAFTLMDSLEKTANEAYPEEGRINRGFLGEATLGSGIAGHFAKKHNALGVNEDDSHMAANAKLGALGAGTVGALGGAAMGAGEFGGRGAAIGAGLGAAAYGLGGGVGGAINGKLHDMYDDHLRSKQASSLMGRLEKAAAEETEVEEEVAKAQLPENELDKKEKDKKAKGNEVSHAEAGEEKSASALMDSLEKLAEREYTTGEEIKDHARFGAGLGATVNGTLGALGGAGLGGMHAGRAGALGGAVLGGGLGAGLGAASGAMQGVVNGLTSSAAKGVPGVDRREDESHFNADARAGALGGGVLSGLSTGIQTRSVGSALGGAAGGAIGGAMIGAGVGYGRDKREEEQLASDLMDSLEKTASGAFGAIKNTLSAASGKGYNAAKKDHKTTVDGFNRANTVEGFKANVKGTGGDVSKVRQNLEGLEKDVKISGGAMNAAKATRDQARGQLAPAAIGVAGVGGMAAGSAMSKDKQQKTASEEFMNGLYKEAATAILDIHTPEVKAYRDPMDGIKFDR